MTFHRGPLCAFDTESDGLDLENGRIVTATVVLLRPRHEPDVRSHLIAVDVDIPAEATAVHGITTEHARANGKPAGEVLDAVAADLALAMAAGVAVVGSNLVFDFTLLDRELVRNGLPTPEERLGGPIAPVLDVLVLDKAVDRFRKGSRKLPDLCAHYGVRIDGAHDSANDALAAARVLWAIGQRSQMPAEVLATLYADRRKPQELVTAFHRLAGMSLADLHAAQVGWYREQSTSLAAYWRQKANELEHRAAVDHPGDAEWLEGAQREAEDLRCRADAVRSDWPLTPAPVAVAS